VKSPLRFISEPLDSNSEGNLALHLREKGYVTISSVFEDDSVDAYLELIRGLVRPTGNPRWPLMVPLEHPVTLDPLRAPRIRQVVNTFFISGGRRPRMCLSGATWHVKPRDFDYVHGWHKDDDHAATGGQQPPPFVLISMAFTNLTIEHGTTVVIPCSHRDINASPFRGAQEKPLLPQKGEVTIWDPRLWHRGAQRTTDGNRIMVIYGVFPLHVFDGKPIERPPAQRLAWRDAADLEERILFGGPFADW
jgi:hypothetical protein